MLTVSTMPELTEYNFGSVMIGDEKVTSDLIIFPDGKVQKDWRRNSGHRLVLKDHNVRVAACFHLTC